MSENKRLWDDERITGAAGQVVANSLVKHTGQRISYVELAMRQMSDEYESVIEHLKAQLLHTQRTLETCRLSMAELQAELDAAQAGTWQPVEGFESRGQEQIVTIPAWIVPCRLVPGTPATVNGELLAAAQAYLDRVAPYMAMPEDFADPVTREFVALQYNLRAAVERAKEVRDAD